MMQPFSYNRCSRTVHYCKRKTAPRQQLGRKMDNKKLLDSLLQFVLANEASDLHISSGLKPLGRIQGDIITIDNEIGVIDGAAARAMARIILPDEEDMRDFKSCHEVDFSCSLEGVARFRVNMFEQSRGLGIAFRIIPAKVVTLAVLAAPEIFSSIVCTLRSGVVQVTGPTGAGKTTTPAAMINENQKEHIITSEDSIEFVRQPKQSLINQREVGAHTRSFANALRAARREDPDVIFVGEMRDLETIHLALTAAETGHLVFGTLHTTSAAKTMDRVIDVFPAQEKDMVRANVFREPARGNLADAVQTAERRPGGLSRDFAGHSGSAQSDPREQDRAALLSLADWQERWHEDYGRRHGGDAFRQHYLS